MDRADQPDQPYRLTRLTWLTRLTNGRLSSRPYNALFIRHRRHTPRIDTPIRHGYNTRSLMSLKARARAMGCSQVV